MGDKRGSAVQDASAERGSSIVINKGAGQCGAGLLVGNSFVVLD